MLASSANQSINQSINQLGRPQKGTTLGQPPELVILAWFEFAALYYSSVTPQHAPKVGWWAFAKSVAMRGYLY